MVGLESQQPEPQSMWDELSENCCPTLSRTERLTGFVACFLAGALMTFLSLFALSSIVLGRPERFAIPYTLGNILSLGSTAFLIGPVKQIKNMVSPNRAGATAIYVGAMVLTLWAAFAHAPAIIVFVLIIVQIGALVWYCASYIPFARQLLGGITGRIFRF
eukprot:tig00000403_g317.t1